MVDFYAIFKDIENSMNPRYHDIFPSIPFSHKPRGKHMVEKYRKRLLDVSKDSLISKKNVTKSEAAKPLQC